MTPPEDDPQPALSGRLHNGRDAAGLATDAERSLRGIVSLAESSEHSLTAAEMYGALSGTARALDQIPEVITRLRALALHEHESGRLRISAGKYMDDPAAATAALGEALDAVLDAFGAVTLNMTKAVATVSDATFDTPE